MIEGSGDSGAELLPRLRAGRVALDVGGEKEICARP